MGFFKSYKPSLHEYRDITREDTPRLKVGDTVEWDFYGQLLTVELVKFNVSRGAMTNIWCKLPDGVLEEKSERARILSQTQKYIAFGDNFVFDPKGSIVSISRGALKIPNVFSDGLENWV